MECLVLVRLNFPAMNQLQLVSVRVNLGEYMRNLFENLKVIYLYGTSFKFVQSFNHKSHCNIHYYWLFLTLFKGTLRIT